MSSEDDYDDEGLRWSAIDWILWGALFAYLLVGIVTAIFGLLTC